MTMTCDFCGVAIDPRSDYFSVFHTKEGVRYFDTADHATQGLSKLQADVAKPADAPK